MKKELLLGSGSRQTNILQVPYENLTTLDIYGEPDIKHDLNIRPLPFKDNEFDEIHAYEVLEHIGIQGDFKSFFEEFTEYHRILKYKGKLVATVPAHNKLWAWGDPGHTRIINIGTLAFLDQNKYEEGVGNSPMSDYRDIYKVSFETIFASHISDDNTFVFILEAK